MQDEFEPNRVADQDAATQLMGSLDRIVEQLATIEGEFVLIARCPNKFNDAGQDDYWVAAQVDEAYWERSFFFVTEDAGQSMRESTGTKQTEGLKSARSALSNTSHIPSIATRCFPKSGEFISIIRHFGQYWFCIAHGTSGDDADIWTWSKEFGFVHVGIAERIDERIGSRRPLTFVFLNKDIWKYLSAAARKSLAPCAKDDKAHRRLSNELAAIALAVRDATQRDIILIAAQSRLSAYDYCMLEGPSSFNYSGRPAVVLADKIVKMTGRNSFDIWLDNISDPEFRTDLLAAGRGLTALEDIGWRELFKKAFGVSVYGDRLMFVIREDEPLLIWENSVFALRDGLLTCIRLCNFYDLHDGKVGEAMIPMEAAA